MISLLSGKPPLLLTVDQLGNWAQGSSPYPGLSLHSMGSRPDLFDTTSGRLDWIRQNGRAGITAKYVAGSNVGQTLVATR